MKTNIELSDELGISERHFYRLLKNGDNTARALWRDNFAINDCARILLLCDYQNRFAKELQKGAPEQSVRILKCSNSILTWAFPKGEKSFEAQLREIASQRKE